MLDCVIVGGGPAGLTAALYLARFHLSVLVIDGGNSRAATIPISRNHAGFPDGINGGDLLGRMRQHLEPYSVERREGHVRKIARHDESFQVSFEDQMISAKTVLLATGVINHRPRMPDEMHDEALEKGLVRYCPVCDGYEVTDQRIAVAGSGAHAFGEARFLRSYTASITLFPSEGKLDMTDENKAELIGLGVELIEQAPWGYALSGEAIEVSFPETKRRFASLYPALGSAIQSELAVSLGAELTEGGCVWVDRHQRTTVPGLYAAGDVVLGLDQISHAMGQAAVAATAIRNDMSSAKTLMRA